MPELFEAEARGQIKDIFAVIKASNRVPMVALIYRHLATKPGVLEWCWRLLGPAMVSGEIPDAARAYAGRPLALALPKLSAADIAALSLAPVDVAAIRYIVTAYNTANPNNLIAARIMQRVLAAPEAAGRDVSAPIGGMVESPLPRLPSLVQLEEMPPRLAEKLRGLRTASDDGERGIVPSLYRHLAHWPGYLEAAADALAPKFADGSLEAEAKELRAAADKVAAKLCESLSAHDGPTGRPMGEDRPALLATLEAFAGTIPEIVVAGRLMSDALSDDGGA